MSDMSAKLVRDLGGFAALGLLCYYIHREAARQSEQQDPIVKEQKRITKVVPLWKDRAHPCMRVHLPADRGTKRHAAMIVFHGGGWSTCWGSGKGTAAWAASNGMVGIEVEYAAVQGAHQLLDDKPVPPAANEESVLEPLQEGDAPYPQCLRDAGRAVRLVRSLAAEGKLPVDGDRVCACGFSAGGWLAAMLCTMDADYLANSSEDDLGRTLSCIPNRAALCYGVMTLAEGAPTNKKLSAAVEVLLGQESYEQASLRSNLSPVRHFGEDTPPLFIWHTVQDATVPVAHAIEAFTAAREAELAREAENTSAAAPTSAPPVTTELHLYGAAGQAGRHAQGLATDNPALCGWSAQLLAWLGEEFCAPS